MADVDISIFKDDINRWRTATLFAETNSNDKYTPIFTLEDEDKVLPDGTKLISMKRIYLEARDPTEYLAAKRIFSIWEPWEKLSKAPFFQPIIAAWRDELERLLRSEAIQEINAMSKGSKATGTTFSAAKWVAEATWKKTYTTQEMGDDDNAKGAGRPSKASVQKEAEIMAREMMKNDGTLNEDWKRLNLDS
jgi:hypothetical protein